jgi:NADH:ubiquinone oxidoreductase subunit 6 (subunit J)
MVISSKNTVHSVFFLILAFVNVSCLFIMIGAEFVGMILLIVYVGAVAVLFLFVVMMLEGNFIKIKQGFLQYMPFGLLLAAGSIDLNLLRQLKLHTMPMRPTLSKLENYFTPIISYHSSYLEWFY